MDSPSSSSSSSTSSSTSGGSDSSGDAAIYGNDSYYNIRRGIELRQIGEDFQGLFTLEPFAKGTVLWKNRANGPAEKKYRRVYGEDVQHLTPAQLKYFIRYGYQQDDDLTITPLTEDEVNIDYSNFWNHSCNPNTLPLDEDHWVAIRDIACGEQLTIDYCTFDSNPFICIDRCLCGSECCRMFVRGDDYRIKELQEKYKGYFLPYIVDRIKEEAALMSQGVIIGGAGGPNNDFSAAAVKQFHLDENLDIEAHNRAGIERLIAFYADRSSAAAATKRASASASSASSAVTELDTTTDSNTSADRSDSDSPRSDDSSSPMVACGYGSVTAAMSRRIQAAANATTTTTTTNQTKTFEPIVNSTNATTTTTVNV